jgi:hypothetical protein
LAARRGTFAAVAFFLVVLAFALVVRGALGRSSADGVFIPELGITVPAEKAAAVRHALPRGGSESRLRAPIPGVQPDRIPAHMLSEDVPVPVSPELLVPTSGWLVSDGVNLVAVYAGAAGEDSAVGRFAIVRQNLAIGLQDVKLVDAGKVGAVTITDAPIGAAVETSALTGELTFRTKSGLTGRLHLANDSIGRER